MSRSLRILYPNAWYHVMNRGASRKNSFHDNDDYKFFLNLLSQIHRRYCFEIHAYCLMPNHYHLLIRTPLANLSRGMRHLDGLYTQYFNRKYQKDGALFRGRYKAILIDAETYLLRLSRYIHLNPIRASLVKHPDKYYWSSYKFYSGREKQPNWVNIKETLSRFGIKQVKNKYCLFVTEQIDHELENFYRKVKLIPVLGSNTFRKKISDIYLKKIEAYNEIPDHKKVCKLPSLNEICNMVSEYYNVPVRNFFEVNRSKGNPPRMVAIYLAAELSGNKFKTIAEYFKNTSIIGVSQIIRRVNNRRLKKTSFNQILDNLTKQIRKNLFF